MGAENLSQEFVAAREECLQRVKDLRDKCNIDGVIGGFVYNLAWEEERVVKRTRILLLESAISFGEDPMQSPRPRHTRSETWVFLEDGTVSRSWVKPNNPTDIAIRSQEDEEKYDVPTKSKKIIKDVTGLDGLRFKLQQLNPAETKS